MEIRDLLPIGISLAVLGIAISFTLSVNADIAPDMACDGSGEVYNITRGMCCLSSSNCNDTHDTSPTLEGNATINLSTGLAKIPAKIPLIVSVVIAVVIIGLLVRGLGGVGGTV